MRKLAVFAFMIIASAAIQAVEAQTAAELRELAKERDAKHDELVSIEKEMARAIQWNNGTIFRRIYGDDFVGVLPTGQTMDKTGWINAIETSGVKYTSFVASDIQVRMFQETAVVTCLWSSRGTQGTKSFTRQWRVIHVYVYGQRGWKTVASQETLLPG